MNYLSQDLLHDALVTEAARAIGAAQRAVVSAAYGDYNGYAAAAREHYVRAANVEALESRLDAIIEEDRRAGTPGFDGLFSKLKKAVSKTVSVATSAVKKTGVAIAKGTTAVLQPVEKALPKPIVNVGKAIAAPVVAQYQVVGGLLTDPKAAIKSAPGKLITTTLTSSIKVTAEVGKLAGSNTVVGGLARQTETAANKLQTYSNAHPVQTVAAAAAVAAVAIAAPIAGPAIGGFISANAGTAAAALGTSALAAAKDLAIKKGTQVGTQLAQTGITAATGGSGGVTYDPATGQAYTAQTAAALAAQGITPPGQPQPGGSGPMIAGGAAGFLVGGPIGAAIGAAAGAMLARRSM